MAPTKRIGKYDVIETIGRGGMGVVFKAADPVLGRLVAIKMMTDGFADNPDLLKRFYREAQSTAILSHPNIVTVYDMGAHDGMPYLVMQFLEGESLDAIIQSRRELSLLTKTNYLVQICYGLQYAHEQGITHRDIKPANIMVLPDGTVKIVDFGIARIGNDRMTRPGQVMGSFYYMSPEQINEREVDARSDIFALGTVAYEFLTFALPFQGQDMFSTISKILNDLPPSLAAYLHDYPVELDAILERALAKDKEDRYQTVDELAFDLARVETQLNKEMVANLLEEAERLTSAGDLAHAKEQLRQLIKLDPQNPSASLRMREVQQEIQKQRRNEHARQLRAEAEQFVAQQDFDTALRLVNQAIALEPRERELKDLRDSVAEKRALHLLLRECMEEARAARQAGDLDGALGSLERLLAAQPNDANALRLKNEIEAEVADRDKQRQLQQLIAEARRQILSRKLAGAMQTLKQVEQLDGNSPALRKLLHQATEWVEQELRRRAVDKAAAEVTAALDLPDPSLAHNLAATALGRFPGEQGLLQLQAQAVRRRVEQCTSMAKDAMRRYDYAEAIRTLEEAKSETESNSFDELLQQARDEAAHFEHKPPPFPPGAAALMGESRSSPSLVRAELRDKSVLELTPPEGMVLHREAPPDVIATGMASNSTGADGSDYSAATSLPANSEIGAAPPPPGGNVRTASGATSDVSGWPIDTLRTVEKQLANYIGSLARIMVKRAASRTADPDELYSILAASLESKADREAFLAKKAELKGSLTSNRLPPEPLPSASPITFQSSESVELTSAAVDHAARMLARHIGPIATVLTKKAAQRADSLRSLYLLLAKHVDNTGERSRFLREAGFSD